jgi:hypothetical protein
MVFVRFFMRRFSLGTYTCLVRGTVIDVQRSFAGALQIHHSAGEIPSAAFG